MYVVSGKWDKAIREGRRRRTVLDVYYNSLTTGLNNGTKIFSDIPLNNYSIRVDRRSENRRSGSVQLANPDLLELLKDEAGASALKPYGAEYVIRTGFEYADGSTEFVPLGVFTSDNTKWQEGSPTIELDLFDRSKSIQRAIVPQTFNYSGLQALQIIEENLQIIIPTVDLIVHEDIIGIRFPGGTTYQGDRWGGIQKQADSMGGEVYFDLEGQPHLDPIPYLDVDTPVHQADWKVDTGENGVLIKVDRNISRTDTYNMIVVMGNPPDGNSAQPWALAEDLDPNSPTYRYGAFGVQIKEIQRNDITSASQCAIVAHAELRNSRGLYKSLSMECLSNPALDVGDIISVHFLDGSIEMHMVDSLTITQGSSMSLTTRIKQVV